MRQHYTVECQCYQSGSWWRCVRYRRWWAPSVATSHHRATLTATRHPVPTAQLP